MADLFEINADELIGVLEKSKTMKDSVMKIAWRASACINDGKTIFTCGNGGSAADAMHLAEELSGRFKDTRRALRGLCLNADPAALTCIANDFGFDRVFSRQLEAYAAAGDMLIVFSSSGNSPNLVEALHTAKRLGMVTAFFGGRGGGKCRGAADCEAVVPSETGARVQEIHGLMLHTVIEYIEKNLK